MTIFPDELESFAENSDHLDVEHLYTLVPAIVVAIVFALQIAPLVDFVATLDRIYEIRTVALIALKGILGGSIGLFLYTAEDTLFLSNGEARTKEEAFIIVISSIIGIGIGVQWIAPWIANQLAYEALQISAIILLGGMWYLHRLVDGWNLQNEAPHLFAGFLLIIAPYIPNWI